MNLGQANISISGTLGPDFGLIYHVLASYCCHDKLSQLKQQLKTYTIPLSSTAYLGSLLKTSKGCGGVSWFTV